MVSEVYEGLFHISADLARDNAKLSLLNRIVLHRSRPFERYRKQ